MTPPLPPNPEAEERDRQAKHMAQAVIDRRVIELQKTEDTQKLVNVIYSRFKNVSKVGSKRIDADTVAASARVQDARGHVWITANGAELDEALRALINVLSARAKDDKRRKASRKRK